MPGHTWSNAGGICVELARAWRAGAGHTSAGRASSGASDAKCETGGTTDAARANGAVVLGRSHWRGHFFAADSRRSDSAYEAGGPDADRGYCDEESFISTSTPTSPAELKDTGYALSTSTKLD